MLLKQSSTAQPLLFQLIATADHIAGLTGATPTVKLSKNGAAGASPAGAVTEVDSTNMPGWYKVAGNATDTGTLGPLVLHATASGADPVDVVFDVVAFDPQSATNLGLSTLTGNVPQTGDAYAIVSDAAFGNAKLVRSTTPANTLSVNNVGAIISVVDVTGSITGNLGGKVLGGGDSDITGVGAWVLDGTGQAIAGQVSKTGYKLAADGLDSITVTAPTTVATSFPSMVVQLWRRFFRKATETSTQLKTYADDGSTVVTTQTIANDGTTQTQGTAS
jgi:hypothetical protein